MTSVYLQTEVAPIAQTLMFPSGLCHQHTFIVLHLVLEIQKKVNFFISVFGLNKKVLTFILFEFRLFASNKEKGIL